MGSVYPPSMTEFITDLDIYIKRRARPGSGLPFHYASSRLWLECGNYGCAANRRGDSALSRAGVCHGPVERAAVDQLNELRPHFARTALMSARMQLERARAASDTLALIGLPALIVGSHAKVLAANHLIEAKTDLVHWRARDRITLKDQSADQLFRTALAALEQDVRPGTCCSRSGYEETAFVAHILPIRRSARDIFIRCVAMLVLTPVTRPEAPPVELVRSLFDLTPVEARVAHGLAAGRTVDDIASEGGTSLTRCGHMSAAC